MGSILRELLQAFCQRQMVTYMYKQKENGFSRTVNKKQETKTYKQIEQLLFFFCGNTLFYNYKVMQL